MARSLYLLRHGETEGATLRQYKGSIDVPLSEEGRRQADRAGAFMRRRGFTPDVLYCSPLSRARETASIVGKHFALEPQPVAGIEERHFGAWEGMTFTEVAAAYPQDFENWAADPLTFSPVGGESTLSVHERVIPTLQGLLDRHPEQDVCVVAHGGVNRNMLCHFLGMSLEHIFRVEQHFACVNVVRFYDGLPIIELMNFSSGLESTD